MKGQIFVINQQKQTGAIAAEDGQHLLFALNEWQEAKPPERGMQVEFEVAAEGHAGAVRLAATGQTPVMSAQAAASSRPPAPAAPAAAKAPPTPPAPPLSVPPPAAASPQPPALRHSGLGIAAFIISLGIGFFALIVLIVGGLAYNEGEVDAAEIIGAAFIVVTLLQLLPLILGIIGLRQAGRKKLFAILGTVISSLALLFALIVMIAGALDDEDTDVGYAEEYPQIVIPPPPSAEPVISDSTVIENAIARLVATDDDGWHEDREARMGVTGDLNGDGRNDVAIVYTMNPNGGNMTLTNLVVFLRQPNGTLVFFDQVDTGATSGFDKNTGVESLAIRNATIQLKVSGYERVWTDSGEDGRDINETYMYVVRNGKLRQVSN